MSLLKPHLLHLPSNAAHVAVTEGKKSEGASPDLGSGTWKEYLRKARLPWKAQTLQSRGKGLTSDPPLQLLPQRPLETSLCCLKD